MLLYMRASVPAVVDAMTGAGLAASSKSAEPDFEVEALLPCFAMRRRDEAIMEDVVETL